MHVYVYAHTHVYVHVYVGMYMREGLGWFRVKGTVSGSRLNGRVCPVPPPELDSLHRAFTHTRCNPESSTSGLWKGKEENKGSIKSRDQFLLFLHMQDEEPSVSQK